MRTLPGAWSPLLFFLTVMTWSSSLYLWVQGALPAACLGACLTGVSLTLYVVVQEKDRMFRRKNNTEAQEDKGLPAPDVPHAQEVLPAGTAHSSLATGVHIRGDIVATGLFCVCGQVTGDIAAPEGSVVVSDGGSVEGNITCLRLEVHGEVRGVCTTGHAEIGATGSVTGGLRYGSLTVHPGGGLCGDISQQAPSSSGTQYPGKPLLQKVVRNPASAVTGEDTPVPGPAKEKNSQPVPE